MGISVSAHVHVKEKIVRPHGGAAHWRKSPLTAAPTLAAESIQLLESRWEIWSVCDCLMTDTHKHNNNNNNKTFVTIIHVPILL